MSASRRVIVPLLVDLIPILHPDFLNEEPDLDRAIYDASNLERPAPVGCCPAGAVACGALAMAGNVWEWTTSSYRGYPAQSGSDTTQPPRLPNKV